LHSLVWALICLVVINWKPIYQISFPKWATGIFITTKWFCQVWWHTAVIPATQEAQVRSWIEANSGKKLVIPYPKEQARWGVTHL
jgi:hypothetical protein